MQTAAATIPQTQPAFRALADPTRRQILMHLSQQELTIAEVADRFDISRGAIKKHLSILEQGRLISVHVRGRERVNRLQPQALKPASDWIGFFNRFWDDRLGALQDAVANKRTNRGDKR